MNTNHHRQPLRKRGPQFLTHCFLALVAMIDFGHGCEHNYKELFSKSSNLVRTAGFIDTQKRERFSLDVWEASSMTRTARRLDFIQRVAADVHGQRAL
ncbi:hypothetical protein CDEST_01430 [Colletotrichum destructivum]|uniref:Uncharacterized protein n=1 Tax=Colletotrichum destructivum TaxID=34406 RepID=A0AAX4HZ06_9PEZI|nr:hypothetical protein CDEST_01430 [Colletotrichum destructivum]